MAYDAAQDREILDYVTPSSNKAQGFCVMRQLDPGACAFSVDSVDWSTPVADMPSKLARLVRFEFEGGCCQPTHRY